MALVVSVAHDFTCPWCWIGFSQAKRLQEEFGVQIDWRGYELWPEDLDFPQPAAAAADSKRPKTPSRLQLAYAAEGMKPPTATRPKNMRTHNAHEAVEYAKTEGVQDGMIERLYTAFWTQGQEINDPVVIMDLARGVVRDLPALEKAVRERQFASEIIGFDDPAYATGVYNVPTFFIEGQAYAEQPYSTLQAALSKTTASGVPYESLSFPPAPADRPYTFINMVTTIDGKTLTGGRDEHVMDLGSKTDHQAMRRIEGAADAVMIGAGSIRATPNLWYPKDKVRVVATRSGDINFSSRFFTDAPERAFVAIPQGTSLELPNGVRALTYHQSLAEVLRQLRELGIQNLLVEGGSEINAELLKDDLIDELFLTLAPKVKLGRDVPTYAGGDPLPREAVQNYELLSQLRIDNELFLRYRRQR